MIRIKDHYGRAYSINENKVDYVCDVDNTIYINMDSGVTLKFEDIYRDGVLKYDDASVARNSLTEKGLM